MKIFSLWFFSMLYGCQTVLFAQIGNNDSLVYRAALENATSKSLRMQKAINIGIEYRGFPYRFENGHQFFLSDKKLAGEIFYNNMLYKNLSLQYDLLLDEVITEHVNGRKIILIKDKVTEFKLEGHVFRKFSKPNIPDKMAPGYYNVMMEGEGIFLLARRVKKENRNSVRFHQEGLVFLEDHTKYYLKRDSSFFEVKNHKSIMRILTDKKDKKKKPAIHITKEMTREDRMINVVKQYIRMKHEP